MSRINRIALRLISQLEDLYVHKGNPFGADNPHLEEPREKWERHRKVIELQKTKQNLERAFAARKIPIRIVYGDSEQISVIPKPGVITFNYNPILDQEPPTAWMIIHNLAHGIFDYIRRKNPHPHSLQEKAGQGFAQWSRETIGKMLLSPSKHPDEDSGDGNPNAIYPTTRSFLNNMITNDIEAFYEIFSQWVNTGRIRLQSENSSRARQWEKELALEFRDIIDEVAEMGVVLHNI